MAADLWIESHAELKDHPKLLRLMRELKITQVEAIGHLHLLWWWAARYADDGDTSAWTPEDLEQGSGWTGEPRLFYAALKTSGFMDDERLHDWDLYFSCNRRREKDRERKALYRASHKDVPRKSRGQKRMSHGSPSLPDQTRPDQTVPDQTKPDIEPLSGKPDVVQTIVDDLNLQTGRAYKAVGKTVELIRARMAEGFTLDDFREVHRRKVASWKHDPEMAKYLRPETLYSKSKFDGYRNEPIASEVEAAKKQAEYEERMARYRKWEAESRGKGVSQ